jgi:hypothetical protein
MNIADPLHPNIPKIEQQYGGAPSPYDDKDKSAVPRRGVQNPPAPKGSGGTEKQDDLAAPRKKHAQVQKHIAFSTGVISRMVMEAARGNKLYAHNGNIPRELTDKMEAFVRRAANHIKHRSVAKAASHMDEDVELMKLKEELVLELKVFFMTL